MEYSMSRMLVETVVKNALKSMKSNPERGVRNLADMALQFADGKFQKNFLTDIQTMLQKKNSAYYELAREMVSYTNAERLCTFGMNLGYNGCTMGTRIIREKEKNLNCYIPWTVGIQIRGDRFEENQPNYHAAIREGESLGIYMWMLFAVKQPEKLLSLVKMHTDSAFCLFCNQEDLSDEFLDEAANLYNVMIVVRYEKKAADICKVLRKRGLLYSVWYPYGQKDSEIIRNGVLFHSIQRLHPAFTVLLQTLNCPEMIQRLVYQTVKQARGEQLYHTVLFELHGDNDQINSIISGDPCSVCFDENGNLCDWCRKNTGRQHNLLHNSLTEILTDAFAKKS